MSKRERVECKIASNSIDVPRKARSSNSKYTQRSLVTDEKKTAMALHKHQDGSHYPESQGLVLPLLKTIFCNFLLNSRDEISRHGMFGSLPYNLRRRKNKSLTGKIWKEQISNSPLEVTGEDLLLHNDNSPLEVTGEDLLLHNEILEAFSSHLKV